MTNSTAELLYNLSKKTFDENDCGLGQIIFYHCNIPIVNKIEKIPVCMEIQMQKIKKQDGKIEYYTGVKITSSKIYYNDTCDNMELYNHKIKLTKLSPKAIGVFLTKIKSDLEKIKFDKLMGKFVIPNGKITTNNIGIDIFADTYSTAEECCVCYEKTYTKTACEHNLCVECWSNVKKKSCPICREYLWAKEYDSDSDDSDNLEE